MNGRQAFGMVFNGKPTRHKIGLPNPESDLSGVSLTGVKAGDWKSGTGSHQEIHARGIAIGNGRLLEVG